MISKQPEHIDMLAMRLHEEIKNFKSLLKKEEKDLSKNDLLALLVAFISYPVEDFTKPMKVRLANNDKLEQLLKIAIEAKQTTTHLAIEQLALQAKENKYGL